MDDDFHYSAISDGEDSAQEAKSQRHGTIFIAGLRCELWMIVICITALLLSILGVLGLVSGPQAHRSLIQSTSCGSTPGEARVRGCTFDLMSWCWLPPACHDEPLSRQHLDLGPWLWYEDVEATRSVTQEVAARGEIPKLFVEESFHQIHCTYIWKKMHRAYLSQRTIDSYVGRFNHTIHCSEVLLRQGAIWDQVDTSVVLKYPTCDDIRTK